MSKQISAIVVGLFLVTPTMAYSNSPLIGEAAPQEMTNPKTLPLECLIEDDLFRIVSTTQTQNNSEIPITIYKEGQKILTFSNYNTTERSYSASGQMHIDDPKLVAHTIKIDRLSGEIVISQDIRTVTGGSAQSKNYEPYELRGVCSKRMVKPTSHKFYGPIVPLYTTSSP